ncbi:unnamed protein product [Bursaphelenchus xylophilus]|uniref:(pine wood nematode) hypothetical protein n=1 Tax=Bursaphelenchus xylophilus TaxID=6326 RepID=A0A1I7SWR6_BURXY|nr:unnamed protein product [Bursaphelenchus xylophilus]CAG9099841.1 unnamed protein product [Bursaphelenchus xylophilus]
MRKAKYYVIISIVILCWWLYHIKTPLNITDEALLDAPIRRLPQVLIIGVRKGGTRALINSLALHSQIKPAKKEVHFFDDDSLYQLGLDWYRAQMPRTTKSQLTIEKTPAYFPSSDTPRRVFEMNPHIKLILIIRHPIARIISDFSQVQATRRSKNLTLLDFESSVFLPNSSIINLKFKPVFNSLYSFHLQNWLKFFSLKQILVVDGDKFRINPLPEIKKVEKFLGLRPEITAENIRFNTNKGFYCFVDGNRHEKCLGERKGRPQVFVEPRVQKMLRKNFKNFNEQFFQLVNKRFLWKKNIK